MFDLEIPGEGDRSDDWCSINEAARRLNVTATAIRNRIKRGTLEVKPNGNHGRLVRVPRPVTPTVPLTDEEPVTGTVPPTVPLTAPEGGSEPVLPPPDPAVAELRLQVSDLQARLAEAQEGLLAMARDAGMAQGEIAGLQAAAEAAQARLAETQADRDAWRAQAERLATPVPHRPWWKLLAG